MNISNEQLKLFYGSKTITDFLPSHVLNAKILSPNGYRKTIESRTLKQSFTKSLDKPVGFDVDCKSLIKANVIEKENYLTILIDDNTRTNIHTRIILPLFLDYLDFIGFTNYKVIIANGTHRKPTISEIRGKILGENLFQRISDKVIIHDCDKHNKFLGTTSFGTPIYIDEIVLDSGMVVPITDSEYHYFAGQAGTVKSICPGVAGRETILKNHPMMFDFNLGFKKEVRLGNTDGNPVIEDMKEIVKVVSQKVFIFGIDAIISNQEIVYLNAGDLILLHELAKEPLRKLSVVKIPKPGDIVIVSAKNLGINLYQSGKAFHAGWNAIRKDGKGSLIVLAPCTDGIGNDAYYKAMESVKDLPPQEAMRFCIQHYCSPETFKIGNQKPVDLFRIIKDVGQDNIHIITDFNPELLKNIFRLNAHEVKQISVADHIKKIILQHLRKISEPSIYIINDPSILAEVEK
ncbi:MAG: lactate racemase domain-containing protein [Candidatus Hodarchaeales archaeon]